MKGELLMLFVILLLGLILCSFLGGKRCLEGMENETTATTTDSATTGSTTSNLDTPYSNSYDNYNHYDGTSNPILFYGPDGGTAKVIKTPNDNTLVITNKNGTTNIYYIDKNTNDPNISVYHGPNGGSAKIITGSNGKQAVEITTPNGAHIIYTGDETINQYDGNSNTTGSDYNTAYNSNYKEQTNTITGPAGNTYSTYDSSAYYNSLPKGIPRSHIVPGEEDLYILKSQVVPPVCPACPAPIVQKQDNDTTKCPPCPPCARCPEPAFDCKKVPNYKAFNPDYMPVPVLSDFSGFGM